MKWNAIEKAALCTVVDQLYRMVVGVRENGDFAAKADVAYASNAAAFIDGVRFAAQFIEDRHLGIARLAVKPPRAQTPIHSAPPLDQGAHL